MMSEAHTARLTEIWERAKAQYYDTVGENIDDTTFPHPSSVEDLVESLERKNNEFKHFRAKRERIFGVLRAACKPIELVGDLAAGGAAMTFPPSTLCFGAVMYLINAADGVSSSYDKIADLLDTLKDFLIRLKVYTHEEVSIELQKKLAETLVLYLDILARSTKVVKAGSIGRFLSYGKKALFKGDDEFQGLLDKLEKLCKTEDRLVGAIVLAEGKKTGTAVEVVSTKMSEVGIDVQDIQLKLDKLMDSVGTNKEENDSKHVNKAKAILEPSTYPLDIINSIAKKRTPRTGEWIRSESSFCAWYNRDIPFLWISGNPGSGKTFLSESIISYLQQEHPQGFQHPSRVSIGYFFFKEGNPKTSGFHQALRDMSYQICSNDPVYAKYVASSCQSSKDIHNISSAWRVLFRNYFMGSERNDSFVYLVIDGIDEAVNEEREVFFEEHLPDLVAQNLPSSGRKRIQIVIAGRPQISDELSVTIDGTGTIPTIHVDSTKNSPDIARYVNTSIKRSTKLSRVSKDLRNEISTTLQAKAQGMFSWVDLMLCELTRKTRSDAIRQALHEAPRGLNKMLEHVLKSFSSTLSHEESDELNTMLTWVACASRPLTLNDLGVILSIHYTDEVLDLENRLRKQFASFFVLHCSDGLTTADLESGQSVSYAATAANDDVAEDDNLDGVETAMKLKSDPFTTEVTFCHASIGDYFRDCNNKKALSSDGSPAIGVNIAESRVEVLKTCLEAVSRTFRVTKSGNDFFKFRYEYVRKFWMSHLSEAYKHTSEISADYKRSIGNLLVALFRDDKEYWTSYNSKWAFDIENTDTVIQWLKISEFLHSLSQDDRETVNQWIQKPAELFRFAAKVTGQEWLERGKIDDMVFKNLSKIIGSLEGESKREMSSNLTANMILRTAKWVSQKKTATWLSQIALCLRDNGHLEEAKEYFTMALKRDSGLRTIRDGLASIYARQQRYEEAIALKKMNKEIIEKELEGRRMNSSRIGYHSTSRHGDITEEDLVSAYASLGRWYDQMGDSASALLHYRKALECGYSLPYTSFVIGLCVSILFKNEFNGAEEVMNLIKGVDKRFQSLETSNLNPLIVCISIYTWPNYMFFRATASSAYQTGNIEWWEQVYQEAINVFKRQHLTETALVLNACLAELYLLWDEKEEKAIQIWKEILAFPVESTSSASSNIESCQHLVRTKYARWLFGQASRAGLHTPEAHAHINRLERMCKEKTKAIEDNDPENDSDAYQRLAHMLLAAGDDEYAKAVFRIVPSFWREAGTAGEATIKNDSAETHRKEDESAPLSTNKKKEETDKNDYEHTEKGEAETQKANNDSITVSSKAERSANSPLSKRSIIWKKTMSASCKKKDSMWTCYGKCARHFTSWTNANICRVCLVDLCEYCIAPLRQGGKIDGKACSPEHTWFHVDEPKRILEHGDILLSDKVITLREFLDRLRRKWDLQLENERKSAVRIIA